MGQAQLFVDPHFKVTIQVTVTSASQGHCQSLIANCNSINHGLAMSVTRRGEIEPGFPTPQRNCEMSSPPIHKHCVCLAKRLGGRKLQLKLKLCLPLQYASHTIELLGIHEAQHVPILHGHSQLQDRQSLHGMPARASHPIIIITIIIRGSQQQQTDS